MLVKIISFAFLVITFSVFPAYSENDETSKFSETTLLITAELEEKNVLAIPSSITLIDQQSIQEENARQLSELFKLAPNVNFATGASRGRFIQIRGVGERSEFVEPVNYSVGVVLDGIDLTGISNAATMLDLQQVEILRGPQGTLYGANGLAGLINLVSNNPSDRFYAKVSTTFENYSGKDISAVVSNSPSDEFGYRFAIKTFKSDGFITNDYLGRDDTNNIDELSLRGKLLSQPSEDLKITTSLFLTDIDNGYDAFSFDQNRITLSDEPGHDKQKTNAVATNFDWNINNQYRLETLISHASSELEYGYDEDWSNPTICDNTECDSSLFGFDWWYSSFDNYLRDNQNTSLDIKLHSNIEDSQINWSGGFYLKNQQIDLDRIYTYSDDYSNQFDTRNFALYGQVNYPLSDSIRISTGLRLERRLSHFTDSSLADFSTSENLWGGRVSIENQLQDYVMLYALISKGYKAGGVNAQEDIPEDRRVFDTESMWNYEAGIKGTALNDSLIFQTSIFYQDRNDIQTKESLVSSIETGLLIQQGGVCPCSFTDLTGNAAKGYSYGIELETRWLITDDLRLKLNLGLLESSYSEFDSFTHINASLDPESPVPYNLSERRLAHAPRQQSSFSFDYFLSDKLTFNLGLEHKDSFYFSDRHDEKSNAYTLFNLNMIYQTQDWKFQVYGKNLTDKKVQTRAFGSFGNDPRNFYTTEAYHQLGSPRTFGISLTKEFE